MKIYPSQLSNIALYPQFLFTVQHRQNLIRIHPESVRVGPYNVLLISCKHQV